MEVGLLNVCGIYNQAQIVYNSIMPTLTRQKNHRTPTAVYSLPGYDKRAHDKAWKQLEEIGAKIRANWKTKKTFLELLREERGS